ncbi:hypothetical protein Tco_0416940 [Tanacetum coccineum]
MSSKLLAFTSFFLLVFSSAVTGTDIFVTEVSFSCAVCGTDTHDCNLHAAVQNPPAVLSLVLAFWATAKAKIINRERQIQALVDKKKVIITEKSVRSDLMLADAEGTECLPNDVIFEQLTLMGYENLTQ